MKDLGASQDEFGKQDDGARLPVVFLHGLFEAPAVWGPVRAALARLGAETCAPPLPGHSGDAIRRPRSEGLHLGDAPIRHMEAVIEKIAAGGRVRLVGHSLGGYLALSVARDRPDLVHDALVIGAPHAGDCGRPVTLATRMVTEWPLVGPLSAHVLHRAWVSDADRFEAWMQGCVAPGERLSRLPAEMRAELRAGCPETMRDMAVWIRGRSSLKRFAAIEVPVTTVVSARDPVVSAAHQIELARTLPGGLAQVIDSGHLPMMTDPVLFERTVRAWHATPAAPAARPPRAASGPERQADTAPVAAAAACPAG